MFALVALMCFYLGTNNLSSAFKTPLSAWTSMSWLSLILGSALILTGIACVWQATKDLKKVKENANQIIKEKELAKKSVYLQDEEFLSELELQENNENIEDETSFLNIETSKDEV